MKYISTKLNTCFRSLGFIAALFPALANAQQESQFANYIHNPYLFNPAAGGMMDLVQIDLGYRNQWITTDGNPSTVYLTGHSRIVSKNSGLTAISEFNLDKENVYKTPERTIGELKHVIGGKFMRDGIGPFQKTSVYGSYAVHLPLIKSLNVGVGLSAGWGNFQVDPNKVVMHDADDAVYSQFAGNISKQNVLDVQTGLVLYSSKFLLSISGTQLLNNKISTDQIETGNTLNRHLFVMSSYRVGVTEKVDLEPFVFIKAAQHSPTSFDLGLRVKYNKSMWAGLQYRRGNSFVLSAGMNFLRNFNFSYAFEYGTGPVRISNAGTHELQLGILLGRNRNMDKEIKETKQKGTETPVKDPELDVE